MIDLQFHVIGLTERKLQKSTIPTYDLNIIGYNYSHTLTEAEKGGALLYQINIIPNYEVISMKLCTNQKNSKLLSLKS